jgi:hypothetical protein
MLSSLKNRPLSYKLNLVAGGLGIIVVVIIFIGAARTLELSGLDSPSAQPTSAQLRAETASLRAELDKLAADLKSIQTELREAAGLPKDAKLAVAQQQIQRTVKDIAERQERLEQIIVSNPVKALEMSILQRDLETIKATQQSSLTAVKATVDRISSLTKWALAAMALCIVLLAASVSLKSKES